MAKPDDTPVASASANTHPVAALGDAPLIQLLEAFLAQLKAPKAAPVSSKSARAPHIKPRRRVTVGAGVPPAIDAHIPRIRLCGHWLVRAGFGPHTRVRVHVANGCLILIPEAAG